MPIVIMVIISGLVSAQSPPETLDNTPVAAKKASETSRLYECIYLIGDYGFYVNWPDKEPPEIVCFERKPAKLISFSSIDRFLSWLQTLPEGARVDQLRTCKRTQAGMPQAASRRLQRIIHDNKLQLTDETDGNFVVCLCEATEFTILKHLMKQGAGWRRIRGSIGRRTSRKTPCEATHNPWQSETNEFTGSPGGHKRP